MKRNLIFIAMLFFFSSNIVSAQQQSVSTTISKNKKQDITPQIKDATQRLDNALIAADIQELDHLVGANLEMTHSNGLKENKRSLIEHLKTGKLKYNSILPVGDCITTIIAANEATVNRDMDVSGTLESQDFHVKLKIIEKWKVENGEWKLIKRVSKDRK